MAKLSIFGNILRNCSISKFKADVSPKISLIFSTNLDFRTFVLFSTFVSPRLSLQYFYELVWPACVPNPQKTAVVTIWHDIEPISGKRQFKEYNYCIDFRLPQPRGDSYEIYLLFTFLLASLWTYPIIFTIFPLIIWIFF